MSTTLTRPTALVTEKADILVEERMETPSQHHESRRTSRVPVPPTIPPPTFQKHTHSPASPHDSANTLSPDHYYYHASPYEHVIRPYQSSSMSSSASHGFAITPISTNELEKSSLSTKDSDPPRRHSRQASSTRDPEKAGARHSVSSARRHNRHHHHHPHAHAHHHHAKPRSSRSDFAAPPRYAATADEAEAQQEAALEARAGRILFFLALPCVALAFVNAFWTVLALMVTALSQPVRLCARKRPGFGRQLGGLVGPALNLQLRGIGAATPSPSSCPHDHNSGSHACDETCPDLYRPGSLVTVQLLAPVLGFGIMVAAWVVAVFWLTSAMIGDPVGLDRRDDGRETVLGLRRWWERWLMRSFRDDVLR